MKSIKKIIIALFVAVIPCLGVNAQESLSLSDAIRIGLESNFDIKIAKQSTTIAEQQNSWGMAGGLPSISLNGSLGTYKELIAPGDTTLPGEVSADLSWVLFDGFSIRTAKAILQSGEELAKGSEMVVVESTIHSIINSYYYVLLQQEMLRITETVMEISKDRLAQQQNSKELGASGTYEYVQAQSAYLTDKSSHLKQEVTLRDAVRSLNLLLSLPETTEWRLTEVVESPKFDYSLSAMTDKMLSDNRTLKNQYISLQTREQELKQSRSSLYPTIGFTASMAYGNYYMNTSNSQDYLKPSVGISLSYNLFNGGKTRRNINIAELTQEAEQLSTDQMTLKLKSELSTQYDGYNVYREIVTLDSEQLEVSELLMKLSEERYRNGTINSFNFREVQLAYLQSATSKLNSIYNLVVANSELLRLTGGLVSYAK